MFNFRGNGSGSVEARNLPLVGTVQSDAARNGWSQALKFAPPVARSLRLRCSYDPKDGAVRAWRGEQIQGPFTAREAPKDGRYVVFVAFSPVSIKRLRVLPGVVPPAGVPQPAEGPVRISLTNGDTMTAQSVTLSDGRFSIKAGYGETQTEPGQVASLQFGGRVGKPVASEAAARVVTSEGRFTLRSCTLSAERLAGQSEVFGAMSIPRDRVRSIQFLRETP
jgi:hypothetical protein